MREKLDNIHIEARTALVCMLIAITYALGFAAAWLAAAMHVDHAAGLITPLVLVAYYGRKWRRLDRAADELVDGLK